MYPLVDDATGSTTGYGQKVTAYLSQPMPNGLKLTVNATVFSSVHGSSVGELSLDETAQVIARGISAADWSHLRVMLELHANHYMASQGFERQLVYTIGP